MFPLTLRLGLTCRCKFDSMELYLSQSTEGLRARPTVFMATLMLVGANIPLRILSSRRRNAISHNLSVFGDR